MIDDQFRAVRGSPVKVLFQPGKIGSFAPTWLALGPRPITGQRVPRWLRSRIPVFLRSLAFSDYLFSPSQPWAVRGYGFVKEFTVQFVANYGPDQLCGPVRQWIPQVAYFFANRILSLRRFMTHLLDATQ